MSDGIGDGRRGQRPVTRRCVLYVSGFDPKGASHYHAMLRDEGEKQSRQNGWMLRTGPRKRLPNGNTAWSLKAQMEGAEVSTDYEFLHWDDIVRAHWTKSVPVLWWHIVRTTWLNLRCGALWRMYRLSWPPALAAFLPFLLVLALLVGTPVVALLMFWLGLMSGKPLWFSALAGLGAAIVFWWSARQLERRYSMYWMMRSYAFNALQAQGGTPELEARLDAHARTLVSKVMSKAYDEVLLVGHSSGANMAASIMARAVRAEPAIVRHSSALSLLTLGQWLPLMGLLPMAHTFRADLQTLAGAGGVHWIDFSAPPDGCCFALLDPLQACGVSHPPGGIALKVLNPRFADMFSPSDYRTLRKDPFNVHFQYLKSSRRPVPYDYFLIVAGTLSLPSRYANFVSVKDYTALKGWPRPRRGMAHEQL